MSPSTDEYQKETEYKTLKKSEKVVWYYKTKKKYPFKEIERWDLTFDEKFDKSSLDMSRWMTQSLWGEKSMDEPYARGSSSTKVPAETMKPTVSLH